MQPGYSTGAITIRLAASDDAEGIAKAFLQTADHHVTLDPERYSVPEFETIAARYREGGNIRPARVEPLSPSLRSAVVRSQDLWMHDLNSRRI